MDADNVVDHFKVEYFTDEESECDERAHWETDRMAIEYRCRIFYTR